MNIDQQISLVKTNSQQHFAMPLDGIHGIEHWERVHENGVYLAKHCGADELVVRLFAYLHDCCRESDGFDHGHGARAADYAQTLRDTLLGNLTGEQFERLDYACEHHAGGKVSDDPTVGACWDSDRLDLGRVGIKPNPKLLCTERAKSQTVINWAYQRSRGHDVKLKA